MLSCWRIALIADDFAGNRRSLSHHPAYAFVWRKLVSLTFR
jgi:hypothetical protein